ncbi:MAG: DUF4169 family protein [Sphingomonas sp.]|uniref:DUF4169 family protein n=1 Tax=Sphingomonas sp. TaxID=28214 RepID=UPI003F7E283C
MAEIVNLNRARKAKARTEAQAIAAANRAAFGRTKAEKRATKAEAERRAKELDGAKREP